MSIQEKLEEIIDKYYRENEDYYGQYRYDKDNNEFNMKKEIEEFFTKNQIDYKISFEYGFDCPGYSNDFLAIAWIEDGQLNLQTIHLECF